MNDKYAIGNMSILYTHCAKQRIPNNKNVLSFDEYIQNHLPILKSLSEQARRIEDESSLDGGNIRLLGFPIKQTREKKNELNWNNFHAF